MKITPWSGRVDVSFGYNVWHKALQKLGELEENITKRHYFTVCWQLGTRPPDKIPAEEEVRDLIPVVLSSLGFSYDFQQKKYVQVSPKVKAPPYAVAKESSSSGSGTQPPDQTPQQDSAIVTPPPRSPPPQVQHPAQREAVAKTNATSVPEPITDESIVAQQTDDNIEIFTYNYRARWGEKDEHDDWIFRGKTKHCRVLKWYDADQEEIVWSDTEAASYAARFALIEWECDKTWDVITCNLGNQSGEHHRLFRCDHDARTRRRPKELPAGIRKAPPPPIPTNSLPKYSLRRQSPPQVPRKAAPPTLENTPTGTTAIAESTVTQYHAPVMNNNTVVTLTRLPNSTILSNVCTYDTDVYRCARAYADVPPRPQHRIAEREDHRVTVRHELNAILRGLGYPEYDTYVDSCCRRDTEELRTTLVSLRKALRDEGRLHEYPSTVIGANMRPIRPDWYQVDELALQYLEEGECVIVVTADNDRGRRGKVLELLPDNQVVVSLGGRAFWSKEEKVVRRTELRVDASPIMSHYEEEDLDSAKPHTTTTGAALLVQPPTTSASSQCKPAPAVPDTIRARVKAPPSCLEKKEPKAPPRRGLLTPVPLAEPTTPEAPMQQAPPLLPLGWETALTQDGHRYYWHTSNRERTQWEMPVQEIESSTTDSPPDDLESEDPDPVYQADGTTMGPDFASLHTTMDPRHNPAVRAYHASLYTGIPTGPDPIRVTRGPDGYDAEDYTIDHATAENDAADIDTPMPDTSITDAAVTEEDTRAPDPESLVEDDVLPPWNSCSLEEVLARIDTDRVAAGEEAPAPDTTDPATIEDTSGESWECAD